MTFDTRLSHTIAACNLEMSNIVCGRSLNGNWNTRYYMTFSSRDYMIVLIQKWAVLPIRLGEWPKDEANFDVFLRALPVWDTHDDKRGNLPLFRDENNHTFRDGTSASDVFERNASNNTSNSTRETMCRNILAYLLSIPCLSPLWQLSAVQQMFPRQYPEIMNIIECKRNTCRVDLHRPEQHPEMRFCSSYFVFNKKKPSAL